MVIKRDIFSKVAGGVRVMPLMERQAQAAKVAAAQQATAAARATEAAALGAVVQLGRQDVQQLVNATLLEQHEAALAAAAQLLQAGALDEAGYEEAAEALAQQRHRGAGGCRRILPHAALLRARWAVRVLAIYLRLLVWRCRCRADTNLAPRCRRHWLHDESALCAPAVACLQMPMQRHWAPTPATSGPTSPH